MYTYNIRYTIRGLESDFCLGVETPVVDDGASLSESGSSTLRLLLGVSRAGAPAADFALALSWFFSQGKVLPIFELFSSCMLQSLQ